MDSRYIAVIASLAFAMGTPISSVAASLQARIDTARAGVASSAPGDTLTFAAALARVFERNASLPPMAARLDAARSAAGQAGAWPNPALALEAENIGGSYAGVDYAELSLLLTQEFELGGRRGARVAVAEQASRSAAFEARIDTLNLFIETRRRYADVVHAEANHELALRTTIVVADLVTAADERVSAGAALLADRALASAALARARMEATRADSDRRRARVALASLWGQATFADPVARTIPIPAAAPPADSIASWVERSPSMAHARLAHGALRAARAVEKSLRVPSLSASFGVRRVQFDDAGTFLLGISAPLPLWDRRGDAIRAADARVRSSELSLSRVRVESTGDLAAQIETLGQLLAQHRDVERTIIPQMQSAVAGLRAAYQMGSASYPDLLELQRTLVALERDQNDTRRAIVEQVAAIERLTGATIEELTHE